MRGKYCSAITILSICMLVLSGCATEQYPDLTDEQYQQTVEYAAGLLMKYSNNGTNMLTYVSKKDIKKYVEANEIEFSDEEESSDTEEASLVGDTSIDDGLITEDTGLDVASQGSSDDDSSSTLISDSKDVANTVESESSETTTDNAVDESSASSMEDLDISAAITSATDEDSDDTNNESSNESSEETSEEMSNDSEAASSDLESVDSDNTSSEEDSTATVLNDTNKQSLGNGLSLTYTGYYVSNSYPQDDDVFVISAGSGKKLLVLSFRVTNESSSSVNLDMVKVNPHFQVILNGENIGYTSITMLENDLSSYSGTIAAGEKKTLVLVKEISDSDAKGIDSLGMISSIGDSTQTVLLE
ncbi:MAG: hypothetical protein K6B41_09505 [Butyrivibrio sp.]|nr:hypothetical protein [Butyrivibrio sp.]